MQFYVEFLCVEGGSYEFVEVIKVKGWQKLDFLSDCECVLCVVVYKLSGMFICMVEEDWQLF